jgi:predicted nuclease of predicted toxin-antitoxin system
LGGAADAGIAAVCIGEQRVLVTQDLDFSDIRAYPPREHAGIIVFRLPSADRDAVLEVAASLIARLATSSPSGQLWIVEDSRIRIRE